MARTDKRSRLRATSPGLPASRGATSPATWRGPASPPAPFCPAPRLPQLSIREEVNGTTPEDRDSPGTLKLEEMRVGPGRRQQEKKLVAERGQQRGPGLSHRRRDQAWDASESLTPARVSCVCECGTAGRSPSVRPGLRRSLSWIWRTRKGECGHLCSPIPRPWSWASSSGFGLTGPRELELPARLRDRVKTLQSPGAPLGGVPHPWKRRRYVPGLPT